MLSHFNIVITLFIATVDVHDASVSERNTPELKLVSVVFRHGDRTPDVVYPKFPYTSKDYLPPGVGELTNNGKARAYELGQILQKRYAPFLGSTYIPDNVYARSTDYDRTKMTLQLVLAGLYPPNALQQWKYDLNWQPIPTHYVPEPQDELFQRIYICDSHINEQERVKKMPHIAQSLARFDGIKKDMTYLTGWNMTHIFDLYTLYCNIICLKFMHWKVPDWSNSTMPALEDSTLETFKIMNYNEVLRRNNGGALVRKISEEMAAVRNGTVEKKRKIFLYSSHDINVYAVLAALKVIKPHLPEFTSAVILELLSINGNYYVKVLHYLGIPAVMQELQIPNCSSLCPLDTFFELTKNVIPSDKELKCSYKNKQ